MSILLLLFCSIFSTLPTLRVWRFLRNFVEAINLTCNTEY